MSVLPTWKIKKKKKKRKDKQTNKQTNKQRIRLLTFPTKFILISFFDTLKKFLALANLPVVLQLPNSRSWVLITISCSPKLKPTSIIVSLISWLVRFYGISTFIVYLTPNPFLCKLSVLFQTIQFSMSTQFNCQNISISNYSVYSNSSNSANLV